MTFSHLNAEGRARMVDVTDKPATARHAVARSSVRMLASTLEAIQAGTVVKGDVLAVAQVAGIMAAKQTGSWIPMCHPLHITGADLHFYFDVRLRRLDIEARVSTNGPTGVEMEALTAASAAALTIYDMAKSQDKTMTIGPTYLVHKEGGKSGPFHHFRARVSDVAVPHGAVSYLLLAGDDQLQLLPEGCEPHPDRPAAWLNMPDLNMLAPGTCLECGPLRLEVLYARERGWLAEVNDPGILRPGDDMEGVS